MIIIDIFFGIPAIIKIILTLALMLILMRFLKNMLLSFVICTFFFAFWNGFSLVEIVIISRDAFLSLDNLVLMLVIFLVIWFSSQMKESGLFGKLVTDFSALFPLRFNMAALPAAIGLLPMPGGAAFSAPLLQEIPTENPIKALQYTQINFWFRHVWEYWWPLYPGVLLASQLSGLEVWKISLLHLPLSLAAIFIGIVIYLRPLKGPSLQAKKQPQKKPFLALLPVVIVIAVYILLQLFFPEVGRLSKYLPVGIGIFLAMLLTAFLRPLSSEKWFKIILNHKALLLALLVSCISLYSAFLTAPRQGASIILQTQEELQAMHVPLWLLFAILPFISGLATGLSVGFVGASFPLVFALLGESGMQNLLPAVSVLAYGCGFLGVLLSPVHVCLILSNKHFNTRLEKSIALLSRPVLLLLLFTISYCLLILFINGTG